MTLRDIANELVAGCRDHREDANLDKLYAPDAVSVEAVDFGDGREVHGIDGIRGKHQWWNATFEEISTAAEGPFLHGDDRFSVIFDAETRNRETGEQETMREIGVYHVKDGKIVREEFFYTT